MGLVTRIRRTEEIVVPHAAEDVWTVLTEVATYPKWWPSALGLRFLNQPSGVLGSEWEVRALVGPTVLLRLEELEPPSNIRIRFFGGGLEGPGGFHLTPEDDATRVAYEVDVFARGLHVAALSQVLPLDWLYGLRMRGVLRSLRRRLDRQREQAVRVTRQAARVGAVRAAEEEAAGALAARAAEEQALRQAAARAAAHDEAPAPAEAEDRGPLELPGMAVGSASGPSSTIRDAAARLARWLRASPNADAIRAPSTPGGAVPPSSNFEVARAYLGALSSGAASADVAQFFEPGCASEEFPNLLLPEGATRNLEAFLDHWTKSLETWRGQSFDLTGATGGGAQVAMEVSWAARATRLVGPFVPGQLVKANLALLLRFQNRRIVRQRTYLSFGVPADDGSVGGRAGRPGSERLGPVYPGRTRPQQSRPNFDIARSYLAALSAGQGGDAIAAFFAADAIQEDLPSRLRPLGAARNLDEIRRARDEDRARLASTSYELLGACGGGSKVALEVRWTGVEPPGREEGVARTTEARQVVFLKFRDGLIVRQRTYECA